MVNDFFIIELRFGVGHKHHYMIKPLRDYYWSGTKYAGNGEHITGNKIQIKW